MDAPLEFVINKLRIEFEQRKLEYGQSLHANFNLSIDIQDGAIVHGMLNGIRFRIPKEKTATQKSPFRQLTKQG